MIANGQQLSLFLVHGHKSEFEANGRSFLLHFHTFPASNSNPHNYSTAAAELFWPETLIKAATPTQPLAVICSILRRNIMSEINCAR